MMKAPEDPRTSSRSPTSLLHDPPPDIPPRADGDQAAPLKLCLTCSVETRTQGDFCPHCGASYLHKRRRPSRRAMWIAGLAALGILVAGAATGLVLKARHDDQVRQEQAQKAEQAIDARRAAAAAAAARRAAATEQRRLAIAERQDVIDGLEASVKRHAQRAVDTGALAGPILKADCQVITGGGPEDLERDRGRFECLAVTERYEDGSGTGYTYTARVDYDTGKYTWQLGK